MSDADLLAHQKGQESIRLAIKMTQITVWKLKSETYKTYLQKCFVPNEKALKYYNSLKEPQSISESLK